MITEYLTNLLNNILRSRLSSSTYLHNQGQKAVRGGIEIEELLRWTHEHQAVIAAMGWYVEPDNRLDRTHAYSLFGFTPFEHYTGINVDTPAYANAVQRENAESVLLASFPSDVKQ